MNVMYKSVFGRGQTPPSDAAGRRLPGVRELLPPQRDQRSDLSVFISVHIRFRIMRVKVSEPSRRVSKKQPQSLQDLEGSTLT